MGQFGGVEPAPHAACSESRLKPSVGLLYYIIEATPPLVYGHCDRRRQLVTGPRCRTLFVSGDLGEQISGWTP